MKWARNKAGGCMAAMLLACAYTAAWADDASPFDPQQHEGTQQLVDELAEQGIPRQWLTDALNQASFSQSVLDAMEGAAERRLRWYEYRDIFLTQQRIEEGAEFISEYEDAFARVRTCMVSHQRSLLPLLVLKPITVSIKGATLY